jgi:predicted O-methyltransferase YrrM
VNWFQSLRYLEYLRKSGHWKGFGIHSPFVFNFVANIMRESHDYYDFKKIKAWRKSLVRNQTSLNILDLGAGSVVANDTTKKIATIARHGAIPEKYGKLLYRMIIRYEPQNILELGSSLGLSTLYLALPKRKAEVCSIEGCPQTAEFARFTLEQLGVFNVSVTTGSFNEKLDETCRKLNRLDFVFFDGDHRKEPTLRYFNECLKYAHNESIFVFDDIHWSKGMENAWQEIIAHPEVTVSIDLFRLGIVFFRKECQKENFIVRY